MKKFLSVLLCFCAVMCCVFSFSACGEAKLISISVSQMPAKTTYYAGDFFDKNGMKIVANFSDGTAKEVYDYTVDKTVLEMSDKSVVVNYLEKSAAVNVSVIKSDREGTPQINYVFDGDDLVIDVEIGAEYNFDNNGWSVIARYENLVAGKNYALSARYYATVDANASDACTAVICLGDENDAAQKPAEYNYFRSKYVSLKDEAQINIKTATYAEVIDMLDTEGKYLIYFGGEWDEATEQNIKDLNDIAVQYEVCIYNFDVKLDGGTIGDDFYLNANLPNEMREQLLQGLNDTPEAEGCAYITSVQSVVFARIPEATLLYVQVNASNKVTTVAIGQDKTQFEEIISAFAS